MAANIFAVNEVKAMKKSKKDTEDIANNLNTIFSKKKIEFNNIIEEKDEDKEENSPERMKKKVKRKSSFEGEAKLINLFKKSFNINNTQNDIDGNHYTLLKTLRWCGFFAKLLGSLLWSYANSIYHFEVINMNKMYSFKYILCMGYRFQPNLMKKSGLFFDVNINAISIIHSILCTIIKYNVAGKNSIDNRGKWVLAKSLFYTIPNSLNVNLNIKIKDKYFAINFSGMIAEIISRIFFPNIGLKIKLKKKPTDESTNSKIY